MTDPDRLGFGTVPIGQTVEGSVTLFNFSGDPVTGGHALRARVQRGRRSYICLGGRSIEDVHGPIRSPERVPVLEHDAHGCRGERHARRVGRCALGVYGRRLDDLEGSLSRPCRQSGRPVRDDERRVPFGEIGCTVLGISEGTP